MNTLSHSSRGCRSGAKALVLGVLIAACVACGQRADEGEAVTSGGEEPLIGAVSLSGEEHSWVEAHPVVRVHYEPWPPFVAGDEDHPAGIAVDYVELVCGELGLDVEYVPMEWSEALSSIERRERVDVLPILSRNDERAGFLAFTRDYVSFPIVIFTRTDSSFVGSLDDLRGRPIAVERDYSMHSKLSKRFPGQPLRVVATAPEALESVATGQADAYVGNLAVASHIIDEQGLRNIKVAAPSGYDDHEQAMGVRSDWPILAELLDRGLEAVTPRGHDQIRHRWLSVRYEHGLTSSDLWLWVTVVAAGAGLLILLILLWNRRLRSEVRHRRSAEDAVKRSASEVSRRENEIDELVAGIAVTAEELSRAAPALLATARSQEKGARAQAAAAEETRQTMQSLLESARRIATTTASLATDAASVVESNQQSAAAIDRLSGRVTDIGKSLRVIRDIADKSDLLALNAELEGVRAGQAGKGFALVAAQMQRLAAYTIAETRSIRGLMSDVGPAIEVSTHATERAMGVAEDTSESSRQIRELSEQQQRGTERATEVIVEIGAVASQTSAATTQLVELAAQLDSLSRSLSELIELS